jgi:hypothetical protein
MCHTIWEKILPLVARTKNGLQVELFDWLNLIDECRNM